MRWDSEVFEANLKARAKELGRSMREVLRAAAALPDLPPWDEQAFRVLIRTRAKELNKPLGKLLASQGLAYNTISRAPKTSRSIGTLQRIADAFELDLGEIIKAGSPDLAIYPDTPPLTSEQEVFLTRIVNGQPSIMKVRVSPVDGVPGVFLVEELREAAPEGGNVVPLHKDRMPRAFFVEELPDKD